MVNVVGVDPMSNIAGSHHQWQKTTGMNYYNDGRTVTLQSFVNRFYQNKFYSSSQMRKVH